jgi:hypothetical protein
MSEFGCNPTKVGSVPFANAIYPGRGWAADLVANAERAVAAWAEPAAWTVGTVEAPGTG